jgi:hypothetical protein
LLETREIGPRTDGVGIGAVVGWCVGALVSWMAAKGIIVSGLLSSPSTSSVTSVLIGGGAGGLMGAVGGAMTTRLHAYVMKWRKRRASLRPPAGRALD